MALPATSRYIGVTTVGGHTARALDFQARTDVFVTMGKPTVWQAPDDPTISDTNPPLPQPTAVALEEPTVFKKAILRLVVPDAEGTIQAYGQYWRSVTPEEAMALGCRWVLVDASFNYNEAPVSAVDSFVTSDLLAGTQVLPMQVAGGYQVGDTVMVGLGGQETTVQSVDAVGGTITLNDPLVSGTLKGTFVTNLSYPAPFEYRQIGVMSHVAHTGALGQTLLPYELMTSGLLEYYYNMAPVPREVNRRDGVLLVLTF